MPEPTTLTIDVVSDVVCPWCFLGERSLTKALSLLPDVAAEVRWRPFQLDPTIPPGGIDRAEYIRNKFGSTERIEASHKMLEERGREVGIDYAFDRITRSPNTLDAHRVIRWAAKAGRQGELVDRLFKLYFSEGEDLGDPTVLADAASAVGMDADEVAADLATDRDIEAVQAEIESAYRGGVSGVPFFIFGGRYAASGAQPVEALVDIIRKVQAKLAADAAA